MSERSLDALYAVVEDLERQYDATISGLEKRLEHRLDLLANEMRRLDDRIRDVGFDVDDLRKARP